MSEQSRSYTAEMSFAREVPIARIEDFRLGRQLGSGAQSRVYEAEHTSGQLVAVKLALDPAINDKEAQLLARLANPHVALLLFRSEPGEVAHPFVAMPPLKDIATLQVDALLPVVAELAKGLDYTHERGVLHGDLKPSNFMTDQDLSGVIVDYGCGWPAEEPNRYFQGDPLFRAPELRPRGLLSVPSDLYSFAASVYYMIYHCLPNLNEYTPSVFRRALSREPSDRYDSATEFVFAIGNDPDPALQQLVSVESPTMSPRLVTR